MSKNHVNIRGIPKNTVCRILMFYVVFWAPNVGLGQFVCSVVRPLLAALVAWARDVP